MEIYRILTNYLPQLATGSLQPKRIFYLSQGSCAGLQLEDDFAKVAPSLIHYSIR